MNRLIDKVKPEVLRALDRHVKLEYPTSHRMMIASLEDVERYRDLTIEQVFQFITFLPTEFKPKGEIDMFYGDHLLQDKYIKK
mgnify:FL=1|jgi:hypothetical protein|tara:strand:- start:40 stop:288 length:249 start_codon:yes stop_codon:yes gene_type:complete